MAEALGVQVQSLEVRGASDWEGAFAAAVRERADAVFVLQDTVTGAQRRRTVELALQHGLPTMFTEKTSVELGGLMFYGGKVAAMARRAATYVDKILKGGNPAELPIERPREFELVINLKTAQALGLTIPPHVLLQATEVI